jgi:hypothetical protein
MRQLLGSLSLLSILSSGVLFSACATFRGDVDRDHAIRAAADACYLSWGKHSESLGIAWGHHDWRARLEGDHWAVWEGSAASPDLSVDVPLDGRLLDPDRACRAPTPDQGEPWSLRPSRPE